MQTTHLDVIKQLRFVSSLNIFH